LLRLGFVLASLCLLLVGGGVSLALADESQSSDLQLSQRQLELALEAEGPEKVDLGAPNTQPEEGLPREGLNREEAETLATAIFEPQLEGSAGFFAEIEVEKFLSDNVALVTREDGLSPLESGSSNEPVLIESTLPLRTEDSSGNESQVSLDLEPSEGALQPENPLTEVEIPQALGEGMSLPEAGVTIELVGAPEERAPSLIAPSTAFYPNVAQDTDLSVAPTPTGFETLTQLRSAAAPDEQEFEVSMPAGAQLKETEDGGAEVARGEETIVSIQPPSALDAEGNPVPVALRVAGDSIRLQVSVSPTTAFPVLVDPTYDYYQWNEANYGTMGWEQFNTSGGAWAMNDHLVAGRFGPGVMSGFSGNVVNGTQANWSYHLPRWQEELSQNREPTSYIAGVTLSNLELWMSGTVGNRRDSPYMLAGIWNPVDWRWEAVSYRNGIEGQLTNLNQNYVYPNPAPNVNAKWFQIGFASSENGANESRYLEAGSAMVELGDEDFPGFTNVDDPSSWVNNTSTARVPFTVTDAGLGVYDVFIGEHTTSGELKYIGTHYSDCTGGATHPCPRAWSSATGPVTNYNPAIMPQGEDWATLTATDPLNHDSAWKSGVNKPSEIKIKVDHTAPVLSLSGTATEQATLGTAASQYTLKYAASDGDDGAAAALVPFGTTGTTTEKTQRPLGIASDRNGHVWVADREGNRVLEFNEEGKFLMQFGTKGSANGQLLNPSGIAVTPSGNLWVADSGNDRVQEFNAKGEYMQQFGTSGAAGGTQFVEPYGVAIGPEGILWVSDFAGDRVGEFRENPASGRFVRDAYGSAASGSGADELDGPAGLATDAKGNLWVVDCEHRRVQEFDPNGKFIQQFGTAGTGNGQLMGPTAIAVAPSGNLLVSDSGNNRVEEFQPSGVYLRQFGSVGAGNAQFSEPRGVVFGASNAAFIADASNHRIARWSHVDQDPQSGVAKVEIKVDGKVAKTPYNQACATKNCLTNGEWIFNSSEYATGSHKIEVVATDGVSLATVKTLEIASVKDAAAPQLSATSAFFTAPEGWLEQKSYSYNATATDPGGYGVKAVSLKIDGKVVKSVSQSCPNGGCSESLGASTINMATYAGGAHPAELSATDVANQTTTKKWTINVDPAGVVPVAEAINTLDAVGETSESTATAATSEVLEPDQIAGGDNPGLKKEGSTLESIGVPDKTTMSTDISSGFVIHGPEEATKITPVSSVNATPVETTEGVAAVSANTKSGVDSVVRPEYDGTLTFQVIREPTSPEAFSWVVGMSSGQSLKLLDESHAEVKFADGRCAFLITSIEAHDATGANVPTSLEVSGNVLTLKVHHQGSSFVYPIVAGQGWEMSYAAPIIIEMPPPEQPEETNETSEEWNPGGQPINEAVVENEEIANPMSSGEKQALLTWANHRGERLTRKQGKRLLRPSPRSFVVPAPLFRSGEAINTFLIEGNECQIDSCDTWETRFDRGSFARGFAYSETTRTGWPECHGYVSWFWALNIEDLTKGAGEVGPHKVFKGENKHLTYWCHFELRVGPIAEAGWFAHTDAMQDWVFPNGYQEMHYRAWQTGISEN
jgi:sugar lactone lactonase YvrE